MSIAAGMLNRRVTLLGPQSRLSPEHEAVTVHKAVWKVWANVRQETTDEAQQDGRTVARVKYTVTMRFRDDVDETWLIKIDGRTLPISAVVVRGRDEELVVTAHEVR